MLKIPEKYVFKIKVNFFNLVEDPLFGTPDKLWKQNFF
jgi:hypothetical protein